MKKVTIVGLSLLLLVACGKQSSSNQSGVQEGGTPPALTGTYASIDANIFQPLCYRCHTGTNPAGGDDFSNYPSLLTSYDIVSGNPEQSQLYIDVKNGVMPKGGPALSAVQVQAIYDWIKNGLPQH